jgi:type IV secretion system protein VirB11
VIYPLDDYVADGSLCHAHHAVLCEAIQKRKNILVFGGMGSGKTTLVNAILNEMVEADPSEDFLILEDTQELQCAAEGTRYLTQTHTNGLRDLVKLTKRMFPGRIIVGEVRDEAALDLMNAWTSGHPGGTGTVHASSPVGALRKMATLARWATDTDHAATVTEAIDLLVGIERTSTGRTVQHVAWVGDALDLEGNYVIRPVPPTHSVPPTHPEPPSDPARSTRPIPSTRPDPSGSLRAASDGSDDGGAGSPRASQSSATTPMPAMENHRGPPSDPPSGPLVAADVPHCTP